MGEEVTSTIFDLRNTFVSLNYYVVPSQRLSLKAQSSKGDGTKLGFVLQLISSKRIGKW